MDASVAEYLDKQIYHKAIYLQALASALEGVGDDEIRTKNVYAQADIKKWFISQYAALDEKFAPYLQLRH